MDAVRFGIDRTERKPQAVLQEHVKDLVRLLDPQTLATTLARDCASLMRGTIKWVVLRLGESVPHPSVSVRRTRCTKPVVVPVALVMRRASRDMAGPFDV